MAEELILPLLGYNGDDEEDDTTDSDGINNDGEDTDSDDTDNRVQAIEYDTSLPSQHQYLGDDLNEISGRIVLDESATVNMPLLTLQGVVLVPGQVLPLQLQHPAIVSMMKNIIEADKTIGITPTFDSKHGTTAEIRSYGEERDENGEGLSIIRVKAEGRQRFSVKETWRQSDGILMGRVVILPEIELTNPLRIPTHKNTSDTLAACTQWPKWVYQLYDPHELMRKIKIKLKNWSVTSNSSTISNIAPSKACEFSYWIAANLPLNDAQRCELLSINCSIQRLRWELSILQIYSFMCCADCKAKICHRDDIIVMSNNGPQGTYVNPQGYVHEMITVNKVSCISLYGHPSTESSWFPGYAWTICRCTNCNNHMGWKFTLTVNKKLKPEWFWGLCRASLESASDDQWKPVL